MSTPENSRVELGIGDVVRVKLGWSEVCMHMRVADKTAWVEITPDLSAQLYIGGRPFSSPILLSEASIYHDGPKLYAYAEQLTQDEKLATLRTQITVGWRVKITNHDHSNESGDAIVTHVSENLNGWGRPGYLSRRVKPRRKTERYMVWPSTREGYDFEVDGLTLRTFNTHHAYANGNRAITLTLEFQPPAT